MRRPTFLKESPTFFWNYLAMSNQSGRLFQIFVAFSEYPNFIQIMVSIQPIIIAYNFSFEIGLILHNVMSALQILFFLVKNHLLQIFWLKRPILVFSQANVLSKGQLISKVFFLKTPLPNKWTKHLTKFYPSFIGQNFV